MSEETANPIDDTVTPKADPLVTDPMDAVKELVRKAGSNPAELEFPTDPWGFTSGLKQSVLRAAGTVRGQDDKHILLMGTLMVLLAHIRARLPADKEARSNALAAEEAARLERNRVFATATTEPETEITE